MLIAFSCWTNDQRQELIDILTSNGFEIHTNFTSDYRTLEDADSILRIDADPTFAVWFKLNIDELTLLSDDERQVSLAVSLASSTNFAILIEKEGVIVKRIDRTVRFEILDDTFFGEHYPEDKNLIAFGVCTSNPSFTFEEKL